MAGIYIHIPFCKRRCDYCAFFSTTLGGEARRRYAARLCREAAERRDYLGGEAVSSVYLGGGTPSQLSTRELAGIFEALNANYQIDGGAEVTMEVNPDDITPAYAAVLRSLPVNRISMGVQSFHDSLLRSIHRRHTAEKAVDAYNILREAGFGNISIDLIYALPGETLGQWGEDLRRAMALRPEHVSAYALSFEEGTPLYACLGRGEVSEPSEDLYAQMYAMLARTLRCAGYEHYEISNFALPGRRARHNSSYWAGVPYLGLGAGAHSFDGASRRVNLPDVAKYVSAESVPCETERLTPAEEYDEMVMTRLRTCEGVSLPELEARFGSGARGYIMSMAGSYIRTGKLRIKAFGGDERLALTEEGVLISDAIISDLMNPD